MARNDSTSAIIDGILRTLLTSGTIATALIIPNSTKVLEKPLDKYFKHLDDRAQQRELRRVLYYMNQRGFINTTDYEHGISISKVGRKRLETIDTDSVTIPPQDKWDHKWRIVFFDVPEKHKKGRDALTKKLKELGFYPLQRSVLVHPYPCRSEVKSITTKFGINKFVSYIETNHIDHQKSLIGRFRRNGILS